MTVALAQFCTPTVIVKGSVTREQDAVDVTLPTPPAGGQAGPVHVPVPADVLVIFPRTVIPAIALTLTVVFDTALGIGELLPASVGCTLVCTLSSAASCIILPTKLCAVSPVSCCDRIQDTTNGDQRAHPFHRNARARHSLLKILGPLCPPRFLLLCCRPFSLFVISLQLLCVRLMHSSGITAEDEGHIE